MEGCPVCGSSACDCVVSNTVAFVRASVRREMQYFKETRESLYEQLQRSELRSPEDTGPERLTGLIHRYWIRYMALEDFLEDFDRQVERAKGAAEEDLTIAQRQDAPQSTN